MVIQVRVKHSPVGFSLVEVLVGILVFAIASAATISVFANTIRSIRRTEDQALANAAIDSDIARVKQLTEIYNACSDPDSTIQPASVASGSFTPCSGKWPDGVTDIKLGDSYYYYPDPTNATRVGKFEAACVATDPDKHITKNLLDYLNAKKADGTPSYFSQPQNPNPSNPSMKVIRGDAAREESANPENYLIAITYTSTVPNVSRSVKIMPVVAAWCP